MIHRTKPRFERIKHITNKKFRKAAEKLTELEGKMTTRVIKATNDI